VTVFGWFELPPIWPENRAFSEQLFSVHSVIGIAIACLAAAHIGAALYHHFVRKDRVLMRMITGCSRSRSRASWSGGAVHRSSGVMRNRWGNY
jgi:cytochrome b561